MVKDINTLPYLNTSFQLRRVFPCSPLDVTCNQKIGSAEEEVAARIIGYCRDKKHWCKIEFDPFLSGINIEYIAIENDSNSRNDLLRRNRQSLAIYKKSLLLYRLKVVSTFGIYHFFGNRRPITPKLRKVPELKLSFTGVVNGMSHVQKGIAGLAKKGAIEIVIVEGDKWIVPTPKLLEPLSEFRVSG